MGAGSVGNSSEACRLVKGCHVILALVLLPPVRGKTPLYLGIGASWADSRNLSESKVGRSSPPPRHGEDSRLMGQCAWQWLLCESGWVKDEP